jgi:hypothetical protein
VDNVRITGNKPRFIHRTIKCSVDHVENWGQGASHRFLAGVDGITVVHNSQALLQALSIDLSQD